MNLKHYIVVFIAALGMLVTHQLGYYQGKISLASFTTDIVVEQGGKLTDKILDKLSKEND